MKNALHCLLATAAVTLGLTGCAGFYGSGVEFVGSVPPGISQAWVQGGQLWMVPQKNQQIQAVTSADGKTVRWSASGEYVVVKQPPKGLRIQINGDWRDLRLN